MAMLDREEARLCEIELALAEDTLRDAKLSALSAEVERIASAAGLASPPEPPRPDPTTTLGTAMLVAEREARVEFLASMGRDLNRRIFSESGRRRRG